MEIVRFDDEVSIPIAAFGSHFRLGPLVGDDSRGRVALIRLPAGGSVGRHPTVAAQLFAVVAGIGVGAGRRWRGPHPRRRLRGVVGAGEEHEAHSPDGATVVCIEGELDVWALAVTADIDVVDHDPDWPQWFDAVAARVWPAVADVAVRIDHVGSTSVPGLAAKPIIDMDIVVASADDVAAVVDPPGRHRLPLARRPRRPRSRVVPSARRRRTCRGTTSTSSSRTTAPTSTTGCCGTCCARTRQPASATAPSSDATPR